jgi:mannitol/fructose-specific phosphotransferase system IIA component (Ntr-type)
MPPFATPNMAAPASLADYTRRSLIVAQLRERDTAGIISELSHQLQQGGAVPDVLPFYQAALNQELLANSATECGLAFPHGRLGGIRRVQFALGRTPAPIIWGAKGSWPVQLIFLLAVPATDAACYLHVLASLAKLTEQPALLAELRAVESADAMLAVLQQVKLRQNGAAQAEPQISNSSQGRTLKPGSDNTFPLDGLKGWGI